MIARMLKCLLFVPSLVSIFIIVFCLTSCVYEKSASYFQKPPTVEEKGKERHYQMKVMPPRAPKHGEKVWA